MIDNNIFGLDINKTTPQIRERIRQQLRADNPEKKPMHTIDKVDADLQRFVIPESAGTIVGVLYIFHVLASLVWCPAAVPDIYISLPVACLVIMLALFLGCVDDVLEVRWREKVVYSLIATVPILLVYSGCPICICCCWVLRCSGVLAQNAVDSSWISCELKHGTFDQTGFRWGEKSCTVFALLRSHHRGRA